MTDRIPTSESSIEAEAQAILHERTPKKEDVIFEPTVGFLDPEGKLSREEKARVIAAGDRTANSFERLTEKVISERGKIVQTEEGLEEATVSFFIQYALAARSSDKISHTSITEQVNAGMREFGGDSPIIFEGVSILPSLRDICSQRHFGFEAFSTRGAILPEGYWRVPQELSESPVGEELEALQKENHAIYIDLTRRGLEHYLKALPREEGEKKWEYKWRVLNWALDDARQVTNGIYLNHFSMHPNSALSLREFVSYLSSSEYPETRELANQVKSLAEASLPTLMRHTEPSPYVDSLAAKRRGLTSRLGLETPVTEGIPNKAKFLGGSFPEESERIFVAAFLANGGVVGMQEALDRLAFETDEAIGEYIREIFEGISLHDRPPRELEMVQIRGNFMLPIGGFYEAVRHRLATHIVGEFTPAFGYTVPEVYKELGVEDEYRHGVSLVERQYELVSSLGEGARRIYGPAFATRAHLTPFSMRISGMDVFHFIKLRASKSAHPDIQAPSREFADFLQLNSFPVFRHLQIKK